MLMSLIQAWYWTVAGVLGPRGAVVRYRVAKAVRVGSAPVTTRHRRMEDTSVTGPRFTGSIVKYCHAEVCPYNTDCCVPGWKNQWF